jgi:hypothetical protein
MASNNGYHVKKIFYEKVGRRYVPVSEYDNELLDSFPKGNHLVMCYPGGTSRRFNIEPNYAAMIAAGRVAEDAMCKAMNKASELHPAKTPITPEQQAAWKKLAEAFGDELATLHGSSINDIAQAGINAMMEEADKLMQNPNVREAFEHFIVVCKLTKEQTNES